LVDLFEMLFIFSTDEITAKCLWPSYSCEVGHVAVFQNISLLANVTVINNH